MRTDLDLAVQSAQPLKGPIANFRSHTTALYILIAPTSTTMVVSIITIVVHITVIPQQGGAVILSMCSTIVSAFKVFICRLISDHCHSLSPSLS
jgi:hypothetical protein